MKNEELRIKNGAKRRFAPIFNFQFSIFNYKLVGILLFLAVCNVATAQDTLAQPLQDLIQTIPAKPATHYDAPSDTSQVEIRLPAPAALDKFRNDPDFNYTKDTEYGKTLWEMIQYYISKFFHYLFKFDGSGDWRRGILITFLIGVAVFGVIKMLGVDVSGIFFSKPPPVVNLSDTVVDENVDKDKLGEMLEKAIDEKQYRLAVRLTYLIVLKRMAEAGQIHWQADKTNRSYLNEINNPALRQPFANLTRLYEYVWYGDFDITAVHYRDIENDFNELNRRLR